ncbi:Hypothetical_protein [Hexamita inflata]|uniref:Hypothetical_protein n=1 Tax=Hexamita inflata TaxID=28002 RepID=A0AA86NJV3_9EUKA|nr:Hypothetical protein HINF_LOCUS8323 [Hexamita inflata]
MGTCLSKKEETFTGDSYQSSNYDEQTILVLNENGQTEVPQTSEPIVTIQTQLTNYLDGLVNSSDIQIFTSDKIYIIKENLHLKANLSQNLNNKQIDINTQQSIELLHNVFSEDF